MITIVFSLFLLPMLVLVAVAILRTANLFTAVMLSGIFSLLMAANFFVLDAADVALTEAVIGAGISTVLFLGALALTAEKDRSPPVGSFVTRSLGPILLESYPLTELLPPAK